MVNAFCAAHRFLHCAVALDLWFMVLCLFGKRTNGEIWKVVPLLIVYNVVLSEREKCKMLWGERASHDTVEVFIFEDFI